MKTLIVVLCVLLCSSVVSASPQLITEQYTVQDGDTLTSIAKRYVDIIPLINESAFKVFREGIVEINYTILKNRKDHEVQTGDVIKINYWRIDANEKN